MKAIFYISAFLILFISVGCKTVNILMDVGEYDEALALAVQKLAKDESRKTKHITVLEEAFEKMNRYNFSHIKRLKERTSHGEGHLWEEIYEYITLIEKRQARVAPILPLVSKSGYEGQFEFMDVRLIKEEASNEAAAYLYQIGSDSLTYALKINDKKIPQKAYDTLRRIGLYFANYKDAAYLVSESKNAGTYNLLLRIDEESIPDEFDLIINAKSAIGKISPWVEYHEDIREGVTYDAITTIRIDEYYVTSGSEELVVETSTVQNSTSQYSSPDSLGNSTGSTHTQNEVAYFDETTRKKECRISASIEIKDFSSGSTLLQKSFVQIKSFDSQGRSVFGNSNSFSSGVKSEKVESFPFNLEMTIDVVNELSERIFKYISKIDSDDLYRAGIAFN